MSQIRLFITAEKQQAETAASLFEPVFEEDGIPIAAFETDAAAGLWTVSLYASSDSVAEIRARMIGALDAAGLPNSIETEHIQDTDWVSHTLAGLKPVTAGRFIVHGSHDRDAARPGRVAVEIDAGQAFGTGYHGTTAGCLDMLDALLKARRPANALDIGAGSGVLAIALARATRRPVIATDIDPVSTEVARANAGKNGVGSLVECVTATGFLHRRIAARARYDLILANILAGPLQAMAPDLARHLAPGGTAILSGLLPHQKARILATCRGHGLRMSRAHYRDGWLTLVLRKGGRKKRRA